MCVVRSMPATVWVVFPQRMGLDGRLFNTDERFEVQDFFSDPEPYPSVFRLF